MSDARRFVLSAPDLAACFAAVGERPESTHPFDKLPAEGGPLPIYLSQDGRLLPNLATLLGIVLRPRIVAAVEMFAPAREEIAQCRLVRDEEGRWVILAYYWDSEEYDFALLESTDEMLVSVADLTGIPVGAALADGFSLTLPVEGLAVLAGIADLVRERRIRSEMERSDVGLDFLGEPLDVTELHRIVASGLDRVDPRWTVSLLALLTTGELATAREVDALREGVRHLCRRGLVDDEGMVLPEAVGLATALAFPVCATRIVAGFADGTVRRLFYLLTDRMLFCGAWTPAGEILLASVDPADAVRAVREVLHEVPDGAVEAVDDRAAVVRDGDDLYEAGDALRAAARYQQALADDPDNADLHATLGLALRWEGELDEARKAISRALELDPDNPTAIRALAWVEYDEDEIEQAADRFEGLCRDYPDEAEHHVGLALTLLQFPGLGRASEADRALQLAIACDPEDATCYLARANLRLDLGDARGALRDADRSLMLDPDDLWVRTLRAEALMILGRKDEARVPLEEVLAAAGDDAEIQCQAELVGAQLSIADGRLDRAEAHLRAAREYLPDNKHADYVEGALHRERGDRLGALAAFTRAVDEDPLPLYLEARADELLRDGKHALAAEDLEHAEAILRQASASPGWRARIEAKLAEAQRP